MRVGLISGSGSYYWAGLADPRPTSVTTRYGAAELTSGTLAGVEVVHVSRHGAGMSGCRTR